MTALLICSACASRTREYPLHGQVTAVAADRTQVTVKHEDIPGFMPAMTMAYRVHDTALLKGLAPGDVIDATLVVGEREAYLTAIQRTGHADLPSNLPTPVVMDVLQPGDRVPDDPLVDQDGATRRLSDWHGRALAVTFIYTRCPLPDFCPLMDKRFGEVQHAIDADPALERTVHLVSISFDPAHDTPAVLKAHAKKLGADPAVWSFLTPSSPGAATTRFVSRFGVSVVPDEAGQTITHNLRTAVIDPDGRLVKFYSGNDWIADTLLNDLRTARGR